MKRTITLVLVLLICLTSFFSCSNTKSVDNSLANEISKPISEPTSSENTSQVPLDTLLVGVQDMTGDFINGFGNSGYDESVKVLTGGYMGVYEIDAQGEIYLNTVCVQDVDTSTDNDGNKTYTFTLQDDIFWNNGDKITAKDYVASALWFASPEWAEAGATSTGADALIGYTEFKDGTTNVFSGVQYISDTEFSVTIDAENLPYYWETVYAFLSPIHFDTYLKNCELISTQDGSYFEFSEGDLLTNCTRIVSEERYAPTVTCGPYSFVSFENQTVTLELNEYFKGDINGNKPTFQYVVQQSIPIETNAEWVISGQVDLVEEIVEHEKIESAKASESALYHSYLRSGYGFLAMLCDTGPTSDINVRWALASLIDRNEVVEYVTGGYGSTVDSEYGIGQWMYQEKAADLQAELLPISFSVDTANNYLDETQWVYEQDGVTSFDRTKATQDGTYLRYNENQEPLEINHLGQDNVLTDIIEVQYSANAPLAGIDFNLDKGEWAFVVENYYDAYKLGENRTYDTFNLATNFSPVFDRYYTWHSDFLGTSQNKAQLSDPELDELIIAMRSTDPNDKDGFLQAWFDYQVRFNELMPQIPLYSNEYYDIYHVNVDNYNTSIYAGYEDIICTLSKSEK